MVVQSEATNDCLFDMGKKKREETKVHVYRISESRIIIAFIITRKDRRIA